MFNNQNIGERGVSRPFIVGLVLLLLFLSSTQDWSSSPNRGLGRHGLKTTGTTEKVKEKVRDWRPWRFGGVGLQVHAA